MTTGPAIVVEGLTKAFRPKTGVFGLDFQVARGSVMALLGPNGAGKTTVVRILSTLLRPDAGRALIDGIDVVAHPQLVQASIGIANQTIDDKLSGAQNLLLFGRLHRLPWRVVHRRTRHLLALFDLTEAAARPVRSYSGGMRRKLDLAVSLVARPSILFLDEPTTGLDPSSRQALWSVIKKLAASGSTVLLTTQNLDEADALADAVTFIQEGHVVARGTPGELKAQVGGRRVELTLAGQQPAMLLASQLDRFHPAVDGAVLRIAIGDEAADLRRLLDAVDLAGAPLLDYQVRTPTLDDVYFRFTGRDPLIPAAALEVGA